MSGKGAVGVGLWIAVLAFEAGCFAGHGRWISTAIMAIGALAVVTLLAREVGKPVTVSWRTSPQAPATVVRHFNGGRTEIWDHDAGAWVPYIPERRA